jgi:hypothetical protein
MSKKKIRKLDNQNPNPDTLALNMRQIQRAGYFPLAGPMPCMGAGLLLWLEASAGDEDYEIKVPGVPEPNLQSQNLRMKRLKNKL